MIEIISDLVKGYISHKSPQVTMEPKQGLAINDFNGVNEARAKVKAIEQMEDETDPKRKRRMKLLIEEGCYDFSDLDF